jgi:hypothetical protein
VSWRSRAVAGEFGPVSVDVFNAGPPTRCPSHDSDEPSTVVKFDRHDATGSQTKDPVQPQSLFRDIGNNRNMRLASAAHFCVQADQLALIASLLRPMWDERIAIGTNLALPSSSISLSNVRSLSDDQKDALHTCSRRQRTAIPSAQDLTPGNGRVFKLSPIMLAILPVKNLALPYNVPANLDLGDK